MATKKKPHPNIRKARKPRPKQPYLPGDGMAPPSHPAIDDAASIYYHAMQDRVALSKEEDQAKGNLIDKMKEHGLDLYETPDGLLVSVLSKSNVKCKKKHAVEANGDGEE